MPIEELNDDAVTQRCAVCQSVNTLPLPSLSIGVGSEVAQDIDARVLGLPQCPTCKAQEFLVRAAEAQPAVEVSTYAQLHGLLVDQLHAQLALAGRVEKRLVNLKLAELTPEVRAKHFPDGLKLAPPAPEQPGP